MRGFVVGGVSSGVGKTVATLASARALADAGYAVQPAKAGPDFIDPSHHEAVTDRPSRTLDPWLCGEDGLRRNYARGSGDVCVVEGMMGLFDGDVASTARVAELLDLPVVLVVDASAGMESVAATALGFRRYAEEVGPSVEVAGIVAQRAHGGRHERGIREALPDAIEYLGRIPPTPDLDIPDRHLGLQMGSESPVDTETLAAAASHLDGDGLAEIARTPSFLDDPAAEGTNGVGSDGDETAVKIAVADDAAFCFRYPETLTRFRERARVAPFSPVAGDSVPDCDGVYLPGGYPELHAEALSTGGTLAELATLAAEGVPILGECGGLMALSRSLRTIEGETYEMADVLPATVRMHDRYRALDHVELRALDGTLTAQPGESIRGHEFHYSSADVDEDAAFAFETARGTGIDGEHDGLTEYETLGTYAHVHPESGAFDRFLEAVGR